MDRKYLELQYYFMKNEKIKMGNKIPYTQTKIEGILLPAFELAEKGIFKRETLDSYLKELGEVLVGIQTEMGKRSYVGSQLEGEEFEYVIKALESFGDMLEDYGSDCVLNGSIRVKKEQIINWCTRVRKVFMRLRDEVKAVGMQQLELFHLNFEKGVLLRSVPGLSPEFGFWGVNYPMISAGIFSVSHPYWYCKGKGRSMGLLYTVTDPDDLIAVYPDDSSTACRKSSQSLGFYDFLDAFLIDDGVPDAFLQAIYPGYRCIASREFLLQNEVCEVLLKSTVRPQGVFIGDTISDVKKEEVNAFSQYYRLPVFEWKDGEIHEWSFSSVGRVR